MPFNAKSIAQTALDAFHGANSEYAEMAGLWGLRCPIEPYFSAKVAEAVWRNELRIHKQEHNTAVTLEESVVYLYERAIGNAVPQQWIRNFGCRGRIDVALWAGNDRPFGAIEVKKWGNNRDDLSRLCRLLDGNSSVEFGLLLFAVEVRHRPGLSRDEIVGEVKNHYAWLANEAQAEGATLVTVEPVYDDPAPDFYNNGRQYGLGFGAAIVQRR